LEIPRIAQATDRIVESIQEGGRVFFLGAGSSGRLGILEAAECPPTFGLAPDVVQAIIAGGIEAVFSALDMVEDDAEAGAHDLRERGFCRKDVLVGISASGESAYVIGAVTHAHGIGAWTVGISSVPGSSLARLARIAVTPLTGPEVVAGSTRLKAATAAKLVLNMLTTASMTRLGYVFDNLMVNVQPTNRKLQERTRQIIRKVTGVDASTASDLMERANGSIKAAILMHRLGASREEAESLLSDSGGLVGVALEAGERKTARGQ
jgi:N-acetylmuramic acid 6-phosphate etherase